MTTTVTGRPKGTTTTVQITGHPPITLRIERCACGSLVAAEDGDWEAIAAAIRCHQDTEQHRRWRGE